MDRKDFILDCLAKRMTYRQIGKLLKISRQRVHQIATGYHSPSNPFIPPEKHKTWTRWKREALKLGDYEYKEIIREKRLVPVNKLKTYNFRKRKALGLPSGEKIDYDGGRDFIRELVRVRDNHTCQICLKKWNKGRRRFDVHHEDESSEGKSHERNVVERDKKNFNKMITLCHKCHFNLDCVKQKMANGRSKLDLSTP